MLTGLDHRLLIVTRRVLGGTPAVPLARGLSVFGEHAIGWLAVAGAGWLTGRHRREWVEGAAGVLAGHASGVVLKRLVRRRRPLLAEVPALVRTHPSSLSFPSAHSCSTAAAAVGYAPLLGRPLMGTLLGGMLVSRVLLGVHHPSDVVVGAAVGAAAARGTRAVLARARRAAHPT
ncbi:phosphatase PAP2 family protein [Geodermatophilus marinus]|uniref:phosphatase PAP2 family protein n=1 Tax=Geodermatophilus sp. LHW52908 TaxID=2303986 RepID=UPI000E3D3C25|nr:phosphatase PAP2 family protein [Geodermatophilus sp. LHW52908]RFU21753.1 PAP2 family protein [Geodermatophilus sp. LHW52908]